MPNFNSLKLPLQIPDFLNAYNEVQAVDENMFALFTVSDETRNFIKRLPPLQIPYGTYKTTSAANTFLSQHIGVVDTKDPLFIFGEQEEKRIGILLGEGLWKWRMFDYAEHSNHTIFNELMSKTVQYLSVKVDKSLFRIITKNTFAENESIIFDAELYNDSYELINEPEINITIEDEQKKIFPFAFSKTVNAYRLDAGSLPVGDYKYNAKVKVGNKVLTQAGIFSVSPIVVEALNTVADHNLMNNLAKVNGGEMVFSNEFDKLKELLKKRDDIKTVAYNERKLEDLINQKWFFFLILLFISAEWFLRKRNGGY